MAKKVTRSKKELGKGIRALLTNIEAEVAENQEKVVKELSSATAEIPVNQIEVNPFQPRKEFDEEALQELSESLQVHGLIQPITVRRLAENQYQLISGERRWRASQRAGLKEIPAYIRVANDQEMLEMALVENIQREQLNPIEIAITYQRLIDECDLTHEKLSERVGKKRVTVTHYLGLLKLPPTIIKALKEKRLSMGHAKALLSVKDFGIQSAIFHQVLKEGLSVRATEALVANATDNLSPQKAKKAAPKLPDAYNSVQENLRSFLGTKVNLKLGKQGKGQIVIPFNSDDDLNRLLDLIED